MSCPDWESCSSSMRRLRGSTNSSCGNEGRVGASEAEPGGEVTAVKLLVSSFPSGASARRLGCHAAKPLSGRCGSTAASPCKCDCCDDFQHLISARHASG